MNIVYPGGNVTVSLAASDKLAVYSEDSCIITSIVGYPNVPSTESIVATTTAGTEYVSAAVSAASTYKIYAGSASVVYEKGASAVVKDIRLSPYQSVPVAVDVTGAVSAAAIMGGIVTSSTAAAVAGTIPTGTVMDASASWAIGSSVDWSVINTGGTNAFTVTAATDHTIVGAAVVAASTSGRFRTKKTAANTFVTYRIG